MSSAGPIPSPWRRAPQATPLRAWRDEQRAAVAQGLERAWRDWGEAWGLPGPAAPATSPVPAGEARAAAWGFVGARDGAAAWLQLPASFDAALCAALWDVERVASPIALAVQADCVRDLVLRIAAALRVDGEAGEAGGNDLPEGPWSGALELVLRWNVRVLLNATAVQGLVPAARAIRADRSPLVPVTTAVGGHALLLRVHLADCELEIGSLGGLQPGDVLRLQHPLDAPLQVRDRAGRALFAASLARRRGFKAVQLAGLPPAASSAKVPS